MMDWVEFTAKTVNDAVTEASIKFEVTSNMLEYEVIETEKSGFLGLFSKPAKIRARKKSEEIVQPVKEIVQPVKTEVSKKEEGKKPFIKKENKLSSENKVSKSNENFIAAKASLENRQSEKISSEKKEEPTIRKEVNGAEIEAIAKKFLADIFSAMDIKAELAAHYKAEEGLVEINIEGEDMGILIGKRGQTLDSLQYLVSLVVNKESSSYLKVKLDTENYRERRKETLEMLAKNIAIKVKRTKHSVSLEPMNPYERRIIHSALQNDKYVITKSEGEEPYRHVVVMLKRENFRKDENNSYGNGSYAAGSGNRKYSGNRYYNGDRKQGKTYQSVVKVLEQED